MGRTLKGSREVLWDPSDRSSQVPKYTSPGESLPMKANVTSLLEKAAQATCTFAGHYGQKSQPYRCDNCISPVIELPEVIHPVLFSFYLRDCDSGYSCLNTVLTDTRVSRSYSGLGKTQGPSG